MGVGDTAAAQASIVHGAEAGPLNPIALSWFTDSLAFATYHPEPGE